jgi:hypothetical protein
MEEYDFVDEITETRIYCGFRADMIQQQPSPSTKSTLMAWLPHSWIFNPRMYKLADFLFLT